MSEANENRIRRGRAPYRLWLAGIAAGTLVAVSVAPPTGWIAREQVSALFGARNTTMGRVLAGLGVISRGAAPTPPNVPDRRQLLAARPTDFPLHLAVAMEAGERRRYEFNARNSQPGRAYSVAADIRGLASRFPAEPGLYAAALRMDTLGRVRMDRPESGLLSGDRVESDARRKPSDPVDLSAFDRDAATGERLEPDNAYFPMMRAVGYFAANRDGDALAAIQRAAGCSRWDEHLADEVNGKWRLAEFETGGRSAVHRAAIAAAILFPHYAQMRAATRLATLQAMQMEEAGKPSEGARIRVALMRVGDLMRVQATSLIGNLVGIADTHIAISRPGGAPAIKASAGVGHGISARERDEIASRRIATMAGYWRRNGLESEVAAMRARCEAGVKVKQQTSRMVDASPFNEVSIVRLVALWCGGTILLANVWWLLVAGGLGSIATARRRGGARERMPRSGPYVLAAAGVLLLTLCAAVLWNLPRFIGGMSQIANALQGMEGGGSRDMDPRLLIILSAFSLAIPVLLGILSGIASVARRVPLRVGLARGFSRVGLPLAALLVIGFCGLCVVTARAEERLNTGLEGTLKHEGRYLSRLTGQEWPGPVE